MADYTITKVRKQWSSDDTHQHVSEVLTHGGSHYARQDVIASIRKGHSWETKVGGRRVKIQTVARCPKEGCDLEPYIQADSDIGHLEDLPED